MRLSCSEEEDMEEEDIEDMEETGAMERALVLWTELLETAVSRIWDELEVKEFYCQAQVQVPGQVQKVQGLRTKDLGLG